MINIFLKKSCWTLIFCVVFFTVLTTLTNSSPVLAVEIKTPETKTAGIKTLGIKTSENKTSKLGAPTLSDRWFHLDFGCGNDEEVEKASVLIRRASAAGLNGALWACGLDNYSRWSDERKARFAKIKAVADESGVEIIPLIWSIGYGTALGFDPNLAEGLPVNNLAATAKAGQIEADLPPVNVPNGSMENWNGKQLEEFVFHDKPGTISFSDSDIVHSGKSSIRFENFTADIHGHGRLMKELPLPPNALYRASIWIRTEKASGDLKIAVYGMKSDELTSARIKTGTDESTDWTKISVTFQVPEDGKIRIYSGVWGGKSGKFWLDDLTVEPLGLVNPLRRPGTPFVVTDAAGQTIYEEGKDWILPEFNLQSWNQNAPNQTLIIPSGSRIADGEKVLIDYYYPPLVGAPQIGTCMSEPKLYEFFEESAQNIQKLFAPKKWFLNMDEIRCAGTCQACLNRNISLAAILGDCVTKQFDIIQKVSPGAEVYIWSDMFDPKHNARADYYVCKGDYTGVWDMIPNELIISCWYYEIRNDSMKFFSDRGFRTQAAAYYDADTLDECADWLETCAETPGCVGIMYTSWRRKFDLIEDFGKMVSEFALPKE